jgi:hypothetical protein
MALDGPRGDGTNDVGPERHLRSSASGADAGPGEQTEPAEPRTRAEYYEAFRGTGKETARVDENARDARTERSGWDAMAADDQPPRDGFRVSPERMTHILDGDPGNGGGHRSGTGKPGKTEFPASWDDRKIMGHVLDVARRPDSPPVDQYWNNRWVCSGTRDRVEVSVVVLRSGEVWTAWPEEGGPGVVRNPRKETL